MGGGTKFFLRTLSMGPRPAPDEGDNSPKTARKATNPYRRLARSISDCREDRAPKGYVPVLVGRGVGEERVLVRVGVLKEQSMSPLLAMAAQEFGYRQEGVLRIPCEPEHFRRMVTGQSSKGR